VLSTTARLASVPREVSWTPCDGGVLLESYSNEVWLFDDVVVRICWRGDAIRDVAPPLSRPNVDVYQSATPPFVLGTVLTRQYRGWDSDPDGRFRTES